MMIDLDTPTMIDVNGNERPARRRLLDERNAMLAGDIFTDFDGDFMHIHVVADEVTPEQVRALDERANAAIHAEPDVWVEISAETDQQDAAHEYIRHRMSLRNVVPGIVGGAVAALADGRGQPDIEYGVWTGHWQSTVTQR